MVVFRLGAALPLPCLHHRLTDFGAVVAVPDVRRHNNVSAGALTGVSWYPR